MNIERTERRRIGCDALCRWRQRSRCGRRRLHRRLIGWRDICGRTVKQTGSKRTNGETNDQKKSGTPGRPRRKPTKRKPQAQLASEPAALFVAVERVVQAGAETREHRGVGLGVERRHEGDQLFFAGQGLGARHAVCQMLREARLLGAVELTARCGKHQQRLPFGADLILGFVLAVDFHFALRSASSETSPGSRAICAWLGTVNSWPSLLKCRVNRQSRANASPDSASSRKPCAHEVKGDSLLPEYACRVPGPATVSPDSPRRVARAGGRRSRARPLRRRTPPAPGLDLRGGWCGGEDGRAPHWSRCGRATCRSCIRTGSGAGFYKPAESSLD